MSNPSVGESDVSRNNIESQSAGRAVTLPSRSYENWLDSPGRDWIMLTEVLGLGLVGGYLFFGWELREWDADDTNVALWLLPEDDFNTLSSLVW